MHSRRFMLSGGMTRTTALAEMTRAFARAGIDAPHNDARRLMASVLRVDGASLIREPEKKLGDWAPELSEAAGRRLGREPVSRIIGEREFYGMSFRISPATLDPRPDTETLIAAGVEIARTLLQPSKQIRIIDVGTGSGCILVSLLAALPGAQGLGTDVSAEALAVAKDNASRAGVSARARFALADALNGISETFDILVSNPPYIATAEIATLSPEVRDFDPRAALDGGPDGLDVYRAIAAKLDFVVPSGWAVFEVGAGQADLVEQIVGGQRPGQPNPTVRRWLDLDGHTRCVALETRT